jgi:MscS family membrane protein
MAASLPSSRPATAPASQPSTEPAASFVERLRLPDLYAQNPLKNWLFLLIALLVAFVVARIVVFILERIAKRLESFGWHGQAILFSGAGRPATLALFTTGLSLGLAQLVMPAPVEQFAHRIVLLLYLVALFWYGFNLVTVVELAMRRFARTTETDLDDQLVPIVRKTLRVFIVILGALFILQNVFQYDIGAWITGLGIAGLAVSLAAQDSLKNLFGSLTILFDRPFVLGQRIKCQGFDGTVEEIGFRSTKLRTAEGTIATMPNSIIVNDPVENWALRPKFRRFTNITITYDTPVAKVKLAVQIIRDLLESEDFRGPIHDTDATRNQDPPRVFFNEFNADSLNIQLFYWFRPATNWWDFVDFNQRLNIRLMEEYEKAGIEFAFPTQTLFLAGDPKRPLAPNGQFPSESHAPVPPGP